MIESLIMIGAMDEWNIPRRQLLWTLGKLDYGEDTLDLLYPEDNIELPALTSADVMATEYDILGATLERHPVSLYRRWLDDERILGSTTLFEVRVGQHVRVAGLLVVRQSPRTAKGHTFLTLEDEDGFINIVLRPHLTERYRRLITDAALLIVEGLVQRQNRTINIVASKIMPMPPLRVS
jgi:error-prone DNA polymerase